MNIMRSHCTIGNMLQYTRVIYFNIIILYACARVRLLSSLSSDRASNACSPHNIIAFGRTRARIVYIIYYYYNMYVRAGLRTPLRSTRTGYVVYNTNTTQESI